MANGVQYMELQNGQEIFREGEMGSSAYIVQSGGVKITKKINDEKKHLATLGQGEIFGEMALIDSTARMASAEAAGEATVIVVTKEMFEQKLSKADPFLRAILKIMAEQIRDQAKNG